MAFDPAVGITGSVRMTPPPGGSFVDPGDIGVGYTAATEWQIAAE